MIHAIRVVRLQPQPCILRSPWRLRRSEGTAGIQQQARVESTEAGGKEEGKKKKKMEEGHKKKQHKKAPPGDVMGDSFGEGYSTRSDEEGFGGIYGGNQSLREEEEDNGGHEKSTNEYDKSQGSEVKEKEKGRHQHEKMSSSKFSASQN